MKKKLRKEIAELTYQEQRILKSAAKLKLKNVLISTKNICREINLSSTYVLFVIKKLNEIGITNSKIVSKGRYSRRREIDIINVETVSKVLNYSI